MRNSARRWTLATLTLLTMLSTLSAGCATRPAPSIAGSDGRRCVVAILTTEQAFELRALFKEIDARTGDVLLTKACFGTISKDVLNETYHLTQ